MAYSNVGTPRFYIDVLQWYTSLGLGKPNQPDVFGLYPSGNLKESIESSIGGHPIYYYNFINTMPLQLDYWGILGHTIISNEYQYINVHEGSGSAATNYFTNSPHQEIVNLELQSNTFTFTYNGFSLTEIDYDYPEFNRLDCRLSSPIGCITMGKIYEMPHSPELKLTMTREMDGVKRIRTRGGADLVKHQYTKPAMWGIHPAWELWDNTANTYVGSEKLLSRAGRRVWDLSFSYLQDSDVFGSNQSLSNIFYTETNYDGQGVVDPDGDIHTIENDDGTLSDINFNYNLLTDDNFYSQVIHKTNGGQLPFIFQPDNTNNNPDQFAICKFDMNSFKFDQVANGVYNVKLKIREVW